MGLLLSPHAVYAVSITLAWERGEVQPLADAVTGYKIYYGTKSTSYTYPPIDVGNVTSYTINDLDENKVYYFSATAYAGSQEESKFSPEASTFNEFTGTAQVFSRKMQLGSCEIEDEPGDTVEVYLSFDFLTTGGSFMFKPEDTRLTCNAGTFIQRGDNTIEAACVKKGPLGIVTLYRFIFKGFGNASIENPLALSAEVFTIFNQGCPAYVIEMKDLLPLQE